MFKKLFKNILKNNDIYGQSIGVHYRGDDKYKTHLGGFLTVVTLVLILINAVELITAFTDHSDQKEKVATLVEDTFEMETINLQENQFDIYVVRFFEIPSFIGTWEAI